MMGEQVHTTRACSMVLPARAVTATAFRGLQKEGDEAAESSEQQLCCRLQRLVLKDSPSFRIVRGKRAATAHKWQLP